MWSIFSCACLLSTSTFFGEMSVKVFDPFLTKVYFLTVESQELFVCSG